MPTIEKFTPRELGDKPWGRELLVAETSTYIGKVLLMRAGHGGALQYHLRKDEAFFLFQGQAVVHWCDNEGKMHSDIMEAGDAYHVPPGAIHQVEAVTDCVFFEASNPVFDDRVRVPMIQGRT